MAICIDDTEDCTADLKDLSIGVLYELISGHPVLDGVGLFKVGNSTALIFIQVSVRNFSEHKKLMKILTNLLYLCQN